MASPTVRRTGLPLDGLSLEASSPPGTSGLVSGHLRLLGAEAEPRRTTPDVPGRITASGDGFGPVEVRMHAVNEASGVVDEATAQAATGIMAVHGRRDGQPRGLALDYVSAATGLLGVQGLLAGLLAEARGMRAHQVTTSLPRAGLLSVSQYLAAEGADEEEACELSPGGPPFSSADGTVFELETLDPTAWAAFWQALGAPKDAVRSGWRPFQFRYATACAPFPEVLHATTRGKSWQSIRAAADDSGAQVCALRAVADRAAEHDGAAPWRLTELGAGPYEPTRPEAGTAPLAGVTVLEAGRRIQAPLTAHLLGLLGAEVIRIEPPGGDPLRGMPPACSGVSARWLALNRGKQAAEVDIKSPSGRERLREMAAEADVFVHNWAPGKAAQLGLDAGDLAAVNPCLVYSYTSGWAGRLQNAPMGTDFMVQARTGMGEAARPSGEPPAPSLMTLLDVMGGLLGTETVLAALLQRERYGHGVRVDSSLLGAADILLALALRRAAEGRGTRRPAGFRRPLRTADGWVAPADAHASEAAGHDLSGLTTADAVDRLRAHGLAATAVTNRLTSLDHDARFAGLIRRDRHGAFAVPDPWSFA
ncbi:acyl-CoA transferase [Streptomyces nanshensis]|nr:acyl-CoA transferase [Streptomyces nanshensis]